MPFLLHKLISIQSASKFGILKYVFSIKRYALSDVNSHTSPFLLRSRRMGGWYEGNHTSEFLIVWSSQVSLTVIMSNSFSSTAIKSSLLYDTQIHFNKCIKDWSRVLLNVPGEKCNHGVF